jgi:hypothetical protein
MRHYDHLTVVSQRGRLHATPGMLRMLLCVTIGNCGYPL